MKRGFTLIAVVLVGLGLMVQDVSAQGPGEMETVRNWYQRYLGREPDAGGQVNWARALCSRPARDVLADFLSSQEYYQRHGCTPDGFVVGLYFDVLSRQPAPNEVNGWVQQLNVDRGDRACVAREFLTAAGSELATRPVPLVFAPPFPTQP